MTPPKNGNGLSTSSMLMHLMKRAEKNEDKTNALDKKVGNLGVSIDGFGKKIDDFIEATNNYRKDHKEAHAAERKQIHKWLSVLTVIVVLGIVFIPELKESIVSILELLF